MSALPLAAGTNEGGHYFWHFSSYSCCCGNPPAFTPEGIVVGFQFFAWAPNSQNYEDSNEKNKIRGPPLPPKLTLS